TIVLKGARRQIVAPSRRHLVAFANADGGELLVGVEDDGTLSGVPHSDALVGAMLEAPKTQVHERTPLPSPSVSRVEYRRKTILYYQTAIITVCLKSGDK